MINHMINEGVTGIDLLVANTDAQALDASLAPYKIQLGMNVTKGLGAGMKPDVGRAAAEESYDNIKTMLEGADLVFILCWTFGGRNRNWCCPNYSHQLQKKNGGFNQ